MAQTQNRYAGPMMLRQNPQQMREGLCFLRRICEKALWVSLCAALSGCIPTATGSTPSGPVLIQTTPNTEASFYPYQTGLKWSYILVGENANQPKFERTSQGLTQFNGQPVYAIHQLGRGTDMTWFRSFSDSGVFLHGFNKPGVRILIDPPMQEYPSVPSWTSGYRWQGTFNLTVAFDNLKDPIRSGGNYTYMVLEQRTVTIAGAQYKAWVVNRQITGEAKGLFPDSQDILFVPYLGEIKTADNLVLIDTNFKAP